MVVHVEDTAVAAGAMVGSLRFEHMADEAILAILDADAEALG